MYFCTAFFAWYEVKQILHEAQSRVDASRGQHVDAATERAIFITSLLKGVHHYLSDPWNVLDLLRICFVSYLFVSDRDASPQFASIAVLLMWSRLLYFCRGFAETGALVRMVVLIMYDMKWFSLLMFIVWISFTHTFYILHIVDPFLDLDTDREETLFDVLMWTYRLTFLAESEVGDDRAIVVHVLWVASTFFSCIVMMNLLIAIMSNTYDRTQKHAVCSHHKERAELVYELETVRPPLQDAWLYVIASFPKGCSDIAAPEHEYEVAGYNAKLEKVLEFCTELEGKIHRQDVKLNEVLSCLSSTTHQHHTLMSSAGILSSTMLQPPSDPGATSPQPIDVPPYNPYGSPLRTSTPFASSYDLN